VRAFAELMLIVAESKPDPAPSQIRKSVLTRHAKWNRLTTGDEEDVVVENRHGEERREG